MMELHRHTQIHPDRLGIFMAYCENGNEGEEMKTKMYEDALYCKLDNLNIVFARI